MEKISCQKINTQFPDLIKTSQGSLEQTWEIISSIENIQPHSLVFITAEKQIPIVLNSKATVILSPLSLQEKLKGTSPQTWLFCTNPELAMRTIKNHFLQSTPYRNSPNGQIDPRASIDSTAKIHPSVHVGAGAVIGAHVEIGEGSYIGANSVVENNVKIGNQTTIHPLVYVGHSSVIGHRCEILPQTTLGSEGYGYAHDERWNHFRIPHTGKVVLHDDVHVGANCSIDRGTLEDTIIGQGTKIDNQCHLAHNSVIGKNCLITAQFGMAGSSKIGNNFVSGGKASVTGHVSIADNVQISGMSGVTKSIEKSGQYGGFPLQPLGEYLKTKAALVQLNDLRKQVQTLFKKQEE